jgi:acylphosphatase
VNTFSKLTINCFLTAVAGILNPLASRADDRAVSGTVTGKVQHVGFRAFILKKAAIEFNLAGWAKNKDDGTASFFLQGAAKRIEQALERIKEGTDKFEVTGLTTNNAQIDPSLKTFTVFGWTSTSRMITKPYDLVFTLRTDGTVVDKHDAKKVFNKILKDTLDPADYAKLRPEDLE